MRRLNGWTDEQASMFEVILSQEYTDRDGLELKSAQIEDLIYENASDDDDLLRTFSSAKRYPQIFDWFGVIDFNAVFVLLLMIAVAGVNMMTGLLIMLFENISTIGLLKSVGMRNRAIARVFLMSAMGVVLKGMIIGNVLAVLFCMVQDTTHFITLDPVNYFVSYVPVHLDMTAVILADAVAFAAIMVLMLIPSLFVLRVDPAKTVKMD
jgi:lipoprotein-releasing system permease protein